MDDSTAQNISLATQAIGQAANAFSVSQVNKRGVKLAREMWDKQGERDLLYWNMQNAYNDPSAQMQRLKDANLNPALMYGTGSVQNQGAALSAKAGHVPDVKAPNFDALGGIVMSALGTQQSMANIARTKAETKAIEERTAGVRFQNELNSAIGIDKMQRNYAIATDRLETANLRESADYNAWQASGFNGLPTDSKDSPLAKYYSAGFEVRAQELKNAKTRGDIQAAERTIKQYEADLAKQGLSPNSPWYVKGIGALLMKAFDMDINSFLK